MKKIKKQRKKRGGKRVGKERKMVGEVENLFTVDPGQIFIVRIALVWKAFISK